VEAEEDEDVDDDEDEDEVISQSSSVPENHSERPVSGSAM